MKQGIFNQFLTELTDSIIIETDNGQNAITTHLILLLLLYYI